MQLHSKGTALALGFALAIGVAQVATAEISFLGETASKWYICEGGDSSHPRTVIVYQMIQEDYRHLDGVYFVFDYEIFLEEVIPGPPAPTGSKVKAVVRKLQEDDSWAKIGKLRARVISDGDEAQAEAVKYFNVTLEPGDVLKWKFSLKNFPAMRDGEGIMLRGGVGPDLE